ncbi:MAG: CopD family protein [Steroidobacteraceae bacterium]
MGTDAVAVAEHALTLLCMYQAVGAAFFVALFEAQVPQVCARVRRLGIAVAAGAAVLVLLQLPLTAARMAGEFAGAADPHLLTLAAHSSRTAADALMLAGLLLLSIGHARAVRVALLGAALSVCAPALAGHTSVNPWRAVLAPLLVVHVSIGAFWLGTLWPLLLTLQREPSQLAAAVLQRFSRMAGWLVPCIALAGFGMAFLLIDDVAVLRRPYGLILLGKLMVFMILMALAALNRWRYTPSLASQPRLAAQALRRSLMAEYLLIGAVLAMTATLTAFFSPED